MSITKDVKNQNKYVEKPKQKKMPSSKWYQRVRSLLSYYRLYSKYSIEYLAGASAPTRYALPSRAKRYAVLLPSLPSC